MDTVLNSFLEDASRRTQRLAAESDVLKIIQDPASRPPARYLLLFEDVEYLKFDRSGLVETKRGLLPVEIRFPAN
jgi:hypothetical protein